MISLGNIDIKKISLGSGEIKKISLGTTTVWEGIYLAQDSDFVNVDGYWVYRGSESEVEIPTHINGELVTSYKRMFSGLSTHNATPVTKVVSRNTNVTNFEYAFQSCKSDFLDLSEFNTSGAINMFGMLRSMECTSLDLSNIDTRNVTNIGNLCIYCKVPVLDMSSFDLSAVTSNYYVFDMALTTTVYVRSQADADKLSPGKPSTLNFVVKP